MKALLVLAILLTLATIGVRYRRSGDVKQLLISLGTFVALVTLGFLGNITRPILPLFLLHIILIAFAWLGLLYYLFRDKYLWWAIFSPVVTIVVYIALALLEGSRYEDVLF